MVILAIIMFGVALGSIWYTQNYDQRKMVR